MDFSFRATRRRFLKSEDGSFTIEAVLWMPVFVVLLCIIADASMIFGRKAEVLRIIQDANRAMSVGKFRDVQTAMDYISDRIVGISPNAVVETTVDDVADVVRTVVKMPASDLTSDVPIGVLDSLTVQVAAEHLLEA